VHNHATVFARRLFPGEQAAKPAFAREAREGCHAGAQRAKAGYRARELRLGKQKYRKQPHAKKGTHCKQTGFAGMDAGPQKTL
jgi:hypothetical protein